MCKTSLRSEDIVKTNEKMREVCLSDDCNAAFEELKHILTLSLVLAAPNGSRGMVVYSDASGIRLANVLTKYYWVIAYASQQLATWEELLYPWLSACSIDFHLEDQEVLLIGHYDGDLYGP